MLGTEIVGSAVAAEVYKDGRRIVNNINQTVNYAHDLKKHYKRLTDIAEKLSARKEDIVAEANKYKTKQFTRECQVWMSRVTKSEEDVQKLKTKYEKVRGKKQLWRVFHHRFSAKLSKSMAEKCDELHILWSDAKFEGGVAVEKLPECVRIMHAPKIEDKPSLHCVVEDILSLLRDENVKKIGLWGMVGIGKTTIMQNLNDNEDIAKMFDIVIWVHVSRDWSVEKLQHVIIDRLKLNMEGITNVDEIAWRISTELECKRYLLLLDEVWQSPDLKKIGIYGNQKDSKVVLATRHREICHEMDALINVKRMSKDDAWKMFKEKVGQNINISGVEPIAKLVVRECAGLPLLIDRVASTFRRKDNFYLWNDGLMRLQRWRSIKVQGMDELIEFLKFCYEDLEADNKKFCFLYTALYPEDYDINIDYLLECWKAEGFIHDADDFKVARGKGHTILDELVEVSLLERSKKMTHVSMNKVLRNMALKISSQSKDFKILVKTQEELQEPPNEKEWQQVNRISLMDSKLCILPELPDCNNLKTLLLQRNNDLKVIPHYFFRYMQNLLVLDLHGTGIASLPSSVSCLTCLRALYLNSCINLMELNYLEELKHLEVLDIRRTGINHLPIQIGYLIQLKCLRMSSNFGPETRDVEFHQNVLSNLSLLEELRIDVDPNNGSWEGVVKFITEEVATLKCLTFLSIVFPDVDCLKSFISTSPFWKEMHFTFHFSVGYHGSSNFGAPESLDIRGCENLIEVHEAIGSLDKLKMWNLGESKKLPELKKLFKQGYQYKNLKSTDLQEGSEGQIKLEPQGGVFDDEAIEMTSNSSEQMEFDSEEIGNEASQRRPEFIQDEEVEQAVSTLKPQAVDTTSNSSEQAKFEFEESGNEASQRLPEFIQDEEMERAISTLEPQGEVFDIEAHKRPRFSRQIEFQIKDNEMEHEADRPEEARLFLMQGGLGLTKPPKDEDWENAKVMNLMDNELSVLPENPRCPKLSALFLKRNYKLRIIPPSFFDDMPALQILNLSRTGIKSLPNSIIRLVNLKRFFLNDCHCFMMLSPKVGELKQLEVLDLEGTEIMDLPQAIKKLTNLTCLEVSFCEYMSDGKQAMQSNAVVPCGIISELSQLEELNIDVNPEDDRWDTHLENIVKEVCVLKRLETLKFYLPRVELLRQFLCNGPLLSNFRFTVGRHVKRIISRVPPDVEFELGRWERCLIYINGEGVPGDIKKVLQHVTAFFLDRHANVKKLSNFGIRNMMQLKCLVMGECNEVQVIIDEADVYEEDDISKIVSDLYATEKIVLGSLEYLYVYYMKSLRSIWQGSVQQNSLILLRSLTLCTCPQLTAIFSQGLLANLCNLEELKVKDCPSVNSIVSGKIFSEDRTSYFLPNLKKISLHYMNGLDNISSGLHIAPKLEWLSFYNCPNLKNPFIDEISSQDLKKIKCERIWWDALEWSNACPDDLNKIFVEIVDIWDC